MLTNATKIKLVLLLTTALAMSGFAGGSARAADGSDVNQLFDPTFMAASACRAAGKASALVLRPGLQLAMAPALAATAADRIDQDDPALWDDLGDYSFPITTRDPLAQRYFDQGLRLTYAFNHLEALRAFRKAQAIDPQCAICYWGEAFALGANINAPMEEGAAQPAFLALAQATVRAAGASERERALIDALDARYAKSTDPEAQALAAKAYAGKMKAAHARLPEDQDIAVLAADAIMNTTPWDYWELDGRTPKADVGDAIAAIEGVLADNPDHPGAIHLYIHLMEASARPERAEPFADRLGKLMPAAGHLVHMPSHIYIRVGRHLDSIKANRAAVEADEAYIERTGAEGLYREGYYPHNIHFVLQSAQFAGDVENVRWAADRLEGKISDETAAEIGWIQAILPSRYYAQAQFGEPDAALAVPDPGDRFPFVKAMWHYMRGLAHARNGDAESAASEAAMIAEIKATADFEMLLAWLVPAPDLLDIARHVVEGRIAQLLQDHARAVQEFETAVLIQDTLPYMEPPYWYYPVRQSLGAALVQAGRAGEAVEVFRRSLADYPSNGWALFGLMEAYRAEGDAAAAAEVEKVLERVWAGDQVTLDLARL